MLVSIMKTGWLALLMGLLLGLAAAPVRAGDDDKPQDAAEAADDWTKRILGYWVTDFDSAVTKAFVTAHEVDEGTRKEMEETTFEIKDGEMTMYLAGEAHAVKITAKSQDAEHRIITADFKAVDEEPVEMTMRVENDRLTLLGKNHEEIDISLGLKRIDKATFEKRMADAGKEDESEENPEPAPTGPKGDYPTATPVPDKPGFAYSPYNNKVVDLRDIPSGTLVADPHFPASEKKYFRAP